MTTARDLLSDPGVLRAAEALRPDADAQVIAARAAWSVLAEPGDGAAGALIGALGPVGALDLALSERGGPAEAVASRGLTDARSRWRPRAQPGAVAEALTSCHDIGGCILAPGDPGWPRGLDDLGEHAPVALWTRGDASALAAAESVSIVGARAATGYGERVAAELAGDLASAGALIVSGGAYGIDGAAHSAALGAGGCTVAFLAGGIDRAYPAGHRNLFERIRAVGAVVSEVPCGGAPTRWRFLQRNRLIAAATLATVVVEAGWRSGSLNTAGHAATLGRPLGAVPGPVSSAASAGCHRLLREYDAICVTCAQEVRELWGAGTADAGVPRRPDTDSMRLLDALSPRSAAGPEELARRSGLAVERVRALLGVLSLNEEVMPRGGGWVRSG